MPYIFAALVVVLLRWQHTAADFLSDCLFRNLFALHYFLLFDLISVLAKWTKQQPTHASFYKERLLIGLLESLFQFIWCFFFCHPPTHTLPPRIFKLIYPRPLLLPLLFNSLSLARSDPLSVYRPVSLSYRGRIGTQRSLCEWSC